MDQFDGPDFKYAGVISNLDPNAPPVWGRDTYIWDQRERKYRRIQNIREYISNDIGE